MVAYSLLNRSTKIRLLSGTLCVVAGLATTVGAAPMNIAPDGDGILGVSSGTTGAGDIPVAQAGVFPVINDQFVAPTGPFNIRTAQSVDSYAGVLTELFDYVGVLFDAPVSSVSSIRVQNFIANDGGWWGPPATVAMNGVPLAASDLTAPDVQVTTNAGDTWTTIASASDYVTAFTGVIRGTGVPTSSATPFATFTFAAQSGINGIRLIGEGGGNVDDGPGFIGIIEFEARQDLGVVFPTLNINTSTGAMTLNTGAGTAFGIQGYSITSSAAIGALKPASWLSVADNYDASNPGPNQVDSNDQWTELTLAASRTDLSESQIGGNGGLLTGSRSIPLGNVWTRNPFGEDIRMEVLLTDGRTRRVDVTYNGASENPLQIGDFNGDGTISPLDWPTVRNNFNTTFAGLTAAEAYAFGDINSDGKNDRLDFSQFKNLYDIANGEGSFAAMLTGVPEPGSLALLAIGAAVAAAYGTRRKSAAG